MAGIVTLHHFGNLLPIEFLQLFHKLLAELVVSNLKDVFDHQHITQHDPSSLPTNA
jgi:hypothetical protein